MSLNLNKTKSMVLSNKGITDCDLNIKIEDIKKSIAYECKFLGVLMDSKLNWKSHLSIVKDKLIKFNAIRQFAHSGTVT